MSTPLENLRLAFDAFLIDELNRHNGIPHISDLEASLREAICLVLDPEAATVPLDSWIPRCAAAIREAFSLDPESDARTNDILTFYSRRWMILLLDAERDHSENCPVRFGEADCDCEADEWNDRLREALR
jgi:hypothetical protein